MSKEEKEKKPKLSEQQKAILEYQQKMQSSLNKITKDLDVKPIGFEAPKGTNGAISTGLLSVDLITGGGFPRHRLTTVSGDSGAGKTTLTSKAIGKLLKNGITTVHHQDLEGATDYQWSLQNGADFNEYLGKRGKPKTLYYIPDFASGDDAMRYCNRVLEESSKIDSSFLGVHAHVILQDSMAALISEELIENDEAGSKPYLAALLSKFLPLIRARLKGANAAFIGINQLRENPRQRFGNPEYEPGGNAPTFYADLKLWLNVAGKAKLALDMKKDHPIMPKDSKWYKAKAYYNEENPDGSLDTYRFTKIKTEKNRVFTPLRETFMRICTEGKFPGIDPVWDTLRFYEEIGRLQFLGMTEVVFAGKTFTYWDLKTKIQSDQELQLEGQALLDSGKAFELYFNRLTGGGEEIAPVDKDEEAPVEE